jgi:hypothetical protein
VSTAAPRSRRRAALEKHHRPGSKLSDNSREEIVNRGIHISIWRLVDPPFAAG